MKKVNVPKWVIKQRQEKEIVCMCNAYDHPHRLGGGKCTGAGWCEAFRNIDSYDCDSCNMNQNGQCDIVTGQEELNYKTCECVAEELRTRKLADEYGHLPLDIEDYWLKKQKEYYSGEY